ncbi:glycosyltransferase [Shewanella sp. UCD-FRSSP16_17]|uniref:glycosyltransferase n=1 Tax=Shewanella sp. UCD-FRSSP16_17 TaxID=1853256 RepID=UPI001E5F8D73|nr:glycosyltransferase [Shewanella sp. UCD-FRSSP16_17]
MSLYFKEQPKYLDACFCSLMEQSLQASEIVLVFDGQLGVDLEAVVNKWIQVLPIKVFRLPSNIGLGKALNFGLGKCNNELVARMDTDDICVPERFAKQLQSIVSNPEVAILGSSIKEVDGETLSFISNRFVSESHAEILKELPQKNPFNHMTVVYRKSAIEAVGGYKDLPYMEDWYLWLRLLSKGYKARNCKDILVVARTGREMIQRRSGFIYIKSEWLMTKAKVNYGISSKSYALIIFLKRSLPRLLPGIILQKVYMLARR